MPVNWSRRWIFVHIPRTGGTSIEIALDLRSTASMHDVVRYNPAVSRYSRSPQHLPYRDIEALIEPGQRDLFFRFTFVRNPWDRLVSEFEWRRRVIINNPERWRALCFPARDLSTFEKFVASVTSLSSNAREDALLGFDGHLDPQVSFLTDAIGDEAMHFIGRYEQLVEDFAAVSAMLNLAPRELPHKNRTVRRPYTDYYSSATRDAVRELYAADIARFGYSFGEL